MKAGYKIAADDGEEGEFALPNFKKLTTTAEDDMEVDEDDGMTNLATFQTYYQQHNIGHRKLYRKIRDAKEDKMIECAEHLYKKGLKEDVLTFDSLSTIRCALDAGNVRLAIWCIDNLCKNGIPKELFSTDEVMMNQQSFLFNLTNYWSEIDYETIMEVLIKKCTKEQLYNLISQDINGQTALMSLIKTRPGAQWNYTPGIIQYEHAIYIKRLDLLLAMAKACDYDVSTPSRYNKNQCYNMPNITQEKVNKYFETVSEEKIDKKVNGFGILEIELDQNTLIYYDDASNLQVYSCQEVNSNIMHHILRNAQDEKAVVG